MTGVPDESPDLDAAQLVYQEGIRRLLGNGRQKDVQEGMKLITIAARNGEHHAISVIASLPRELSLRSKVVIVPSIVSADDAHEMEDALRLDPLNLGGRLKLLFYYRRLRSRLAAETPAGKNAAKDRELAERIRGHMLWLINNCPDAPFMPIPWEQSVSFGDGGLLDGMPAGQEDIKAAWLRQIELNPTDARIITNAATYIRQTDSRLAWDLMNKVEELNDKAVRTAHLADCRKTLERRESLVRTDNDQRAAVSRWLLEASERILNITSGTNDPAELAERADMYRVAGMSALQVGDFDHARRYAEALLSKDERFKNELAMFPLARHYGHVILGRIAFHNRDIAAAKAQLLAAQEALPARGNALTWTRREGLIPMHPDTTLADSLLATGAREEVLKYLQRCAELTPAGPTGGWADQIRAGKKPALSAGFEY